MNHLRTLNHWVCSVCLVAASTLPVGAADVVPCGPTAAQVLERCNAALAAIATTGEHQPTIADLGLDTMPSTLEAIAPYCGDIVLWYLAATQVEAGDLQAALKWYDLARRRTLLRRLANPREFVDKSRRTVKDLETVFSAALDGFIADEPEGRVWALSQAITWDKYYPSYEYPPDCYPGLYAEVRSRQRRKLSTLKESLAP